MWLSNGQLNRLFSEPVQATLSIKIAPVPCPNAALEKAMASIVEDIWKLDTILTGVKKKLKIQKKDGMPKSMQTR